MVLLLDRSLVSHGFAGAVRARPLLYTGLFGTWAWMFYLLGYGHELVASTGNAGLASAGISPLHYFVSQGGVLLHYLRLSVFPLPLCLDYRWAPATGIAAIVPTVIYSGAAIVATVAMLRGSQLGLAVVAFFLLLAPSSSLLPIADLAAEHRMYLALALVLLLLVVGVVQFAERREASFVVRVSLVGVALVIVLATLTFNRNRDYHSELAMYAQTVRVRPDNARARYNLGNALDAVRHPAEAVVQYRRALALSPQSIDVYNNLGMSYLELGSVALAKETFEAGLAREPENAILRTGLAQALYRTGAVTAARAELDRAIALDPRNAPAHANLGMLLIDEGRSADGLAELEKAAEAAPDNPDYALALAAARSGSAGTLR